MEDEQELRDRITQLEDHVNWKRKSLAQEIAEGLHIRGCWIGNGDTDLITAVGKAIDERDETIKNLTHRETEGQVFSLTSSNNLYAIRVEKKVSKTEEELVKQAQFYSRRRGISYDEVLLELRQKWADCWEENWLIMAGTNTGKMQPQFDRSCLTEIFENANSMVEAWKDLVKDGSKPGFRNPTLMKYDLVLSEDQVVDP